MARDTLLTYPDFKEGFKIRTDYSEFQLGRVIIHKRKLIIFYSKRLTYSQYHYTVTERELLGIFETLKEFITIFLGHKIRIYIDHKKLTCNYFNTNRELI